jgi:hypothetical protein
MDRKAMLSKRGASDPGDPGAKPSLTIDALQQDAAAFARAESRRQIKELHGVTDGKAVGTYIEHRFLEYLQAQWSFAQSSSAKGIDLPDLGVDIKVTSIRQPQSSCPYTSARQKIYGLGYSLLIFVYEKADNDASRVARLNILHVVFVVAERTADYQMTSGLQAMLKNNGNKDDLIAFMLDRNLPVDDIEAGKIADELLAHPPALGYLTISNALQWRLQYSRVIEQAGAVDGIVRLR